jgi:pterin-4a-carbinolamine dehydratase
MVRFPLRGTFQRYPLLHSKREIGIRSRIHSTICSHARVSVCRFMSTSRPDPLARRPNQKCDPYGQGGKPLGLEDSNKLLKTLDEGWTIEYDDNGNPIALCNIYVHNSYVNATAFISKIAAVGDVNNHFPEINLQRKLLQHEKRWEIRTTVKCHTIMLGGLSRNDFFIAMLMDVEAARPEARRHLLIREDATT